MFKYFKKQGGFKFVWHLIRARVFLFSAIELLLLGFSKTSLEILRLAIQLKIKNKLQKKYRYVLEKISDNDLQKKSSNKIWICWFQGIENAPIIVKKCFDSVKKYLIGYEVIEINSKNLLNYVSFPDYILEKRHKKIISDAHFSDMLRLELLIKYGGIWIDSTILCTSSNIPKYITNSDLFLYQCLKPGRDGHAITISNWMISAKTNDKLLIGTKALLYEYWKINNFAIDYYIFHMFFEIASEKFKNERKNIPKICNSVPHILLLEFFDNYNEERFKQIKDLTLFHKLSYKFSKEQLNKKGTFYEVIANA
jgi:mannosyltransferase OCH1-like enzyme